MTAPGDPEAPRVLTDPVTGRPVLMAPQRRHRPYLMARADVDVCPFCPGREDRTPPETDAERPGGGVWVARAFANLYPATPWHEIVAEGARHAERPASLDAAAWGRVLALHRRRVQHLEAQPGVACVFVFKNVGRRAGASIAHNHTQVLGLPVLPPRIEAQLAQVRGGRCPVCDDLAGAEREGRLVWRGRRHAVLCPRAPKTPNETWLVPLSHGDDWLRPDEPDELGRSLHALFDVVDRALDRPPFNLVLHRAPRSGLHWRYEMVVRSGNLAGLEVGGDMYINVVPAEQSAARLRGS